MQRERPGFRITRLFKTLFFGGKATFHVYSISADLFWCFLTAISVILNALSELRDNIFHFNVREVND